jgi:thiol-disulfide isomerase/thioredoxin
MDALHIIILFALAGLLLLSWMNWSKLMEISTANVVNNNGAVKLAGNGKKSATLTLYSASWCGACRFFRPTWDTVKQNYAKSNNSNVIFKEVDCSNTDAAKKIIESTILNNGEKITGYPTVTISLTGAVGQEEKFAGPADSIIQLTDKINKTIA